MKNEGLKQANMLANWFDMNDIMIDDVIITIKLKNDSLYKIMSDGSIIGLSTDVDAQHAFANAAEAIASIETKQKPTKDSVYKVTIKSL